MPRSTDLDKRLATRAAGMYPSVLSYGFDISSSPNGLLSFMTGAPGILLNQSAGGGRLKHFVTGADFIGNDLNKLYCITYASSAFFSLQVATAVTNMIATVLPVGAGQVWTGMAAIRTAAVRLFNRHLDLEAVQHQSRQRRSDVHRRRQQRPGAD